LWKATADPSLFGIKSQRKRKKETNQKLQNMQRRIGGTTYKLLSDVAPEALSATS